MFIVALFTIAKIWKQRKCLLTADGGAMWYLYTMEYYSYENEFLLFVTT